MKREKKTKNFGEIVLYKTEDGKTALDVRLQGDTVWLSQAQLVKLFARNQSVISRHIGNVFEEGELGRKSNMQKMHIPNSDKPVVLYSLDLVISVGYRVKSREGVRFRQWATSVLKEHLVKGFTLHRTRFEENATELEAALKMIHKTANREALSGIEGRGLVDIIARYTQTFLLLQRYDEGLLTEPKGTTGGTLPRLDETRHSIATLKADLIGRREAGPLFEQEREQGLAAILGNLDQSAFGEPAYPTIESKAAHLL